MARKIEPTLTLEQAREAAMAEYIGSAQHKKDMEAGLIDAEGRPIEKGLTDIEEDFDERDARRTEERDEEEEILAEDEEESAKATMSETLRKYRVGYVKAVSYSKGATLDNGDALATALRGLTPDQSCALADLVLGTASGHHKERYASLNVGQQRMNSGNRVRALIKKGETDIETVLAQLAEVLKATPDA